MSPPSICERIASAILVQCTSSPRISQRNLALKLPATESLAIITCMDHLWGTIPQCCNLEASTYETVESCRSSLHPRYLAGRPGTGARAGHHQFRRRQQYGVHSGGAAEGKGR